MSQDCASIRTWNGITSFRPTKSKAAIFCGPSISQNEARELLPNAEIFSPIKRGDLLPIIERGFNVIGIIDGTYINQPTVGATEIINALERGAAIYGAASLGAIRAVELESYGMIGIGTIYAWYKQQITYRDDEVVVPMHPDDYTALADPLINLRYICNRALESGFISVQLADRLLKKYSEIEFQHRKYPRLFNLIRTETLSDKERCELESLELFIQKESPGLNLKYLDAVQLINHIKQSHWLDKGPNDLSAE